MGIKSKNDIPQVEGQRNKNNTMLENILKRNDTLTEYSEKGKTQYREIKDNLSPEELSDVQEERRHIREDGIKKVMQKLRNIFGKNYDYNIFKETEADVSKALNEKPLPQKSIKKQLQRKSLKPLHKSKNRDYER